MSLTSFHINGNDYPAYATVAEADAYLAVDTRYSSAWSQLNPEDKQIKLIEATRRVDRLAFAGSKTNPAQPTQFPRDGSNSVPSAVEEASILEAGFITVNAPSGGATASTAQIKRVEAEGNIEYFQGGTTEATDGEASNADALALLRPFLSSGASSQRRTAFTQLVDYGVRGSSSEETLA